MHSSEKQRVRAKNKRAPTLIEKARELLRISGVKTTLIINEDPDLFSQGKVHMYTNEDRTMIEVLEGYVHHLKTKRPYYLVNHDAPDATFVKKHTQKRKFSANPSAVLQKKIGDRNPTVNTNIDTMEDDESVLDDLLENTEIYKKGQGRVAIPHVET
jgi:hypothetical protein